MNATSYLEYNATPFADQRSFVAEHDQELSMSTGKYLLVERNGVVFLLVLLGSILFASSFLFSHVRLEISHIVQVASISVRFSVHSSKIVGISRDSILPALLDGSLMRISDGSEKVGCCPSWLALKPKVQKVLLCMISRSKVQAFSFVDEQDFVD